MSTRYMQYISDNYTPQYIFVEIPDDKAIEYVNEMRDKVGQFVSTTYHAQFTFSQYIYQHPQELHQKDVYICINWPIAVINTVYLYPDGSCLKTNNRASDGPSGYAWVMKAGTTGYKEGGGGFQCSTSVRMEMYALIHGLQQLKRPCMVHVYTDSEFICNVINRGWIFGWSKKAHERHETIWKKKDGKPVENQDLWEILLKLLNYHTVQMNHIRGHHGHPENEQANALAQAYARNSNLQEDTEYLKRKRVKNSGTASDFLGSLDFSK